MKHTYIYTLVILVLTLGSCNDDFLEKYPQDSLNEKIFWKTEQDLKIYNTNLYNELGDNGKYKIITGYWNSAWSSGSKGIFWEDCKSDNCAPKHSSLNEYAKISAGLNTTPSKNYPGGWYWGLLRNCNVFMQNYQRANIPEKIKKQYAAEVRLIRGWFYFDKVKTFGDVPWTSKVVNIDSEILLGKRDNRNTVMDSVLVDLNFAVDNIWTKYKGSKSGHFDLWTALAIKSRICLYEGTYRKYRNIPGSEKFLEAAAESAERLINEGKFELSTNYKEIFTSSDLSNNKGVILFRQYVTGIFGHRFNGYYGKKNGATKSLVEDFLCTDGKPIMLSPLYKGDATIKDVYVNRDPRLSYITVTPGTVGPFKGTKWGKKPMPCLEGQTTGMISTTGYTFAKFFDYTDWKKGYGKEENDAPIIRLAEVMLNFAEAKAELGKLSQADLDKSINKIRDRVKMPHLDLNPSMDPKYASENLPSIIIEIRRERRIELAVEGFRYDDIIRWKKGKYLKTRILGMRLEDDQLSEYPKVKVKTTILDGKKYIDVYKGSQLENRVFDENKNYLMPIPLNSLSLNPQLGQNPGW